MKKTVFILIVLYVGIIYSITEIAPFDKNAVRVDPGQLHTGKSTWAVVDSTTSDGTEPTDLAADERTYQTVKAAIVAAASGDDEISVYDVPRSWNAVRFRCIGITNNATVTYQIYLGTLGDGNRHTDSTSADCELAYAGQLAFTIGQQASTTSTYEMADTLTTPTASDWEASWDVTSPTGDRVACAQIDLLGADLIVAVPTTAGCDCKLLAKGY